MARVALDDFADKKVSRIYIAGELTEARRVEEILSAIGVDYAVELESYVRLTVFSSDHTGASFYVISEQEDFCKRALVEAGL